MPGSDQKLTRAKRTTAGKAKTPKSDLRRLEILKACALEMRKGGVLNARLQDIAARLGVAYTALYHYFKSRDQLVAEVLLLTFDARAEALQLASGASALERLQDFIRRDIATDKELKVLIPPTFGLKEQQRNRVIERRDALKTEVLALLKEGRADGSIGEFDLETLANYIMDLLDVFAVFDGQLQARASSTAPEYIANQVAEILARGVLVNRGDTLQPSFQLPAGDMLLGTRRGVNEDFDRLDSLLQAATRAINSEGGGASIPRMAASIGLSKTVFYQYFTDKQDLLYHCYQRSVGVVEVSGAIAAGHAISAFDEMLIHRLNLYIFHDSIAGPFTSSTHSTLDLLRPEQQRVIRARNHGIRQTHERRMTRACEEGSIRADVDVVVALPMFGRALYGLPGWHTEAHPLSVLEVQAELARIMFKGIGT